MELETVNKLYLELSQFATAKTKNDLELEKVQERSARRGKLLADIFNCDAGMELPVEIKQRIDAELMGHNNQVQAAPCLQGVEPATPGYAGDNQERKDHGMV